MLDLAGLGTLNRIIQRFVAFTLMRSFGKKMLYPFVDDMVEMVEVEADEVIETFAFYGRYP